MPAKEKLFNCTINCTLNETRLVVVKALRRICRGPELEQTAPGHGVTGSDPINVNILIIIVPHIPL